MSNVEPPLRWIPASAGMTNAYCHAGLDPVSRCPRTVMGNEFVEFIEFVGFIGFIQFIEFVGFGKKKGTGYFSRKAS